ncbi:MAG TPA: EAL domain-containing protein [Gemmatimonadales bacterium]
MTGASDGRGERVAPFRIDGVGLVAAMCAVVVAAYCLGAATGLLDLDQRVLVGDVISGPLGITATVLAALCARQAATPALRRAWGWLAAGAAAYATGDVVWFYHNSVLGTSPSFSWIDWLYIAHYPLTFLGLVTFPGAPRSRASRMALAMDVVIVQLAAGMLFWHFLLLPLASGPGTTWTGTALAVTYPLGDLLLLTGVVRLLLSPRARISRAVLALLAVAPVVNSVADVAYAIYSLQGEYRGGHWPDQLWALGWLSTILAASLHHRLERRDARTSTAATAVQLPYTRLLPVVAVAVAYALVLFVAVDQWVPDLGSLVIGAILLTTAVVARQMLADTRARNVENRLRSLVRHSSDAIMVLGADLTVRYSSPAAERIFGFAPRELQGRRPRDYIHPEDVEQARSVLLRATSATARPVTVACRLRRSDGSWCHVESIVTNRLHDDAVQGLVMNVRDVSERTALEETLAYQAFHDPLTGLANRARFGQRVEQALARAEDEPGRVALLFLDLDDFKRVNDSLGHTEGDRLLVVVAERLLSATRGCDTVARLGGDEFAVLMENVRQEGDAVVVAERVLAAMRAPVSLRGNQVLVATSVGIARAQRGDSADTLIRNADVAMYMAKREGKDRCRTFDPSMQAGVLDQLELETDLRAAIEKGGLSLAFQPIVEVGGRSVMAVEALARWSHPTRGNVPPATFIPLAEETGLIIPLGRWVLHESCREAASWGGDGAPAVSVNVSARQLQDPMLPDHVTATLAGTGLAPHRLILEMTESIALHDLDDAMHRLNGLREIGVRLAIDDFGSGYSSLSYLQRLQVDVLKIDRALLDRRGPGNGTSLLHAVLQMARALDLQAVVEGVELGTQHEELTRLGCPYAQGFLYARPMPPSDIPAMLELAAEERQVVG